MRVPQMRDEQTLTLEADEGNVFFRADGSGSKPRGLSPLLPEPATEAARGFPCYEGRSPLMPSEIDVILAKEGNREAFRRLYEEHRERVFRTACRYTESRQDAEDILQETFVKAFARIRTFDFRVSLNFASWLAAICVNTALDDMRRRGRRMVSKHVSLADLPAELPAGGPSPEATAARHLAVERVRETLRILSPGQRAIFDLRFTEHLAIREIAGALGCSESNVKTQLARALAKLRKTLEPEWGTK
jgi:RNA polymerase sigma-70 factor (ECF subfamily)